MRICLGDAVPWSAVQGTINYSIQWYYYSTECHWDSELYQTPGSPPNTKRCRLNICSFCPVLQGRLVGRGETRILSRSHYFPNLPLKSESPSASSYPALHVLSAVCPLRDNSQQFVNATRQLRAEQWLVQKDKENKSAGKSEVTHSFRV